MEYYGGKGLPMQDAFERLGSELSLSRAFQEDGTFNKVIKNQFSRDKTLYLASQLNYVYTSIVHTSSMFGVGTSVCTVLLHDWLTHGKIHTPTFKLPPTRNSRSSRMRVT